VCVSRLPRTAWHSNSIAIHRRSLEPESSIPTEGAADPVVCARLAWPRLLATRLLRALRIAVVRFGTRRSPRSTLVAVRVGFRWSPNRPPPKTDAPSPRLAGRRWAREMITDRGRFHCPHAPQWYRRSRVGSWRFQRASWR